MVELAATATDGLHTYFCLVAHTAATRTAVGAAPWIAPTQLVSLTAAWPDAAREYLGFCLAMPNYRNNLRRFGFSDDDLDTASDRLLDALVVPDEPGALAARIDAHHAGRRSRCAAVHSSAPRSGGAGPDHGKADNSAMSSSEPSSRIALAAAGSSRP